MRVQLLEGGISSLKSQMGEIVETRDDATNSATEQSRQSRMLEAHVDLSKNELDLLKQKESTSCDMEVVGRKAMNANGDKNEMVGGFRRDTFCSYASL